MQQKKTDKLQKTPRTHIPHIAPYCIDICQSNKSCSRFILLTAF